MNSIPQFLHSMDGEHKGAPDACKYCQADVEFKSEEGSMFSMTIKHDDDCPLWILIQATEQKN